MIQFIIIVHHNYFALEVINYCIIKHIWGNVTLYIYNYTV